MGYRSSRAIHIHRIDFSETSQIVTFFTLGFGKITAIAKGAKRQKNSYDGPIDVLIRSEATWIQRPPDRLNILTHCSQEDPCRSLRTRRSRLLYGFWMILVLNRLTAPGQSNRPLFQLSETFLNVLGKTSRPRSAGIWFDLFALKFLGHLPEISKCTGCERLIQELDEVYFSMGYGGIICDRCVSSSSRSSGSSRQNSKRTDRIRSPSTGSLRLMSALLDVEEPFRDPGPIRPVDGQVEEIRRLLNHTYRYLLGYTPSILSSL